MKANELMIGNFLRYRQDFPDAHLQGKIVKVCGVRGRVDVRTINDGNFHESEHPNWLEPIPLTSEILEKNGFERSEVFVEWKYENDNVYMIYKPFPYLKIETEECIVAFPCEYIHQLQHALRLCEIEKEIIL